MYLRDSSFLRCHLQVHEEPFADRQSTLPSSLPPSETMGNLVPIRGTRSFQSEKSMQRAKHMQETWLLLEYCDKGSLQVSVIANLSQQTLWILLTVGYIVCCTLYIICYRNLSSNCARNVLIRGLAHTLDYIAQLLTAAGVL